MLKLYILHIFIHYKFLFEYYKCIFLSFSVEWSIKDTDSMKEVSCLINNVSDDKRILHYKHLVTSYCITRSFSSFWRIITPTETCGRTADVSTYAVLDRAFVIIGYRNGRKRDKGLGLKCFP